MRFDEKVSPAQRYSKRDPSRGRFALTADIMDLSFFSKRKMVVWAAVGSALNVLIAKHSLNDFPEKVGDRRLNFHWSVHFQVRN